MVKEIDKLYTKNACGPCMELKWWIKKMGVVVNETIDVTDWDASQLAGISLRSVPGIVVNGGADLLTGTVALAWVKAT